ncbi:Fpg/Nei family DNA glycosylase [Microbacterium sp. STN6]|uniref:DNA-formamidopyrimidine glycosylase family protein n=1 Tax=Microbacterium sp. STN6 TaxID=2995588 RepID=UPI00226083E4|nr:DNA-formamidopyrimidine glycosylase family protein [Microbacterium sp. STN6]MCX7523126.1 Fpg/Nei family DNA glycosylase [Microbacterium sp. STN6]
MPEGDTVYQAARRLDSALRGEVVTRSDFRVPTFATVDLCGETMHEVVSRGKHVLMHIGEYTVRSHLKMEGTWRLYRPGERWQRPAHEARLVLETERWQAVGFALGELDVVARRHEGQLVGHLGPDLLGRDWDADEALRRVAAAADAPIAVAMLDQRNLAGLGNVYVNELCFLRGMLPTRPVRDADLPATIDLAHRLIVANRNRVSRTTTGDDRRGRRLWVYGRAGEACRRCGTRIRHSRLGPTPSEERDAYFCPHCQS